jgi:hypothetical protein
MAGIAKDGNYTSSSIRKLQLAMSLEDIISAKFEGMFLNGFHTGYGECMKQTGGVSKEVSDHYTHKSKQSAERILWHLRTHNIYLLE